MRTFSRCYRAKNFLPLRLFGRIAGPDRDRIGTRAAGLRVSIGRKTDGRRPVLARYLEFYTKRKDGLPCFEWSVIIPVVQGFPVPVPRPGHGIGSAGREDRLTGSRLTGSVDRLRDPDMIPGSPAERSGRPEDRYQGRPEDRKTGKLTGTI